MASIFLHWTSKFKDPYLPQIIPHFQVHCSSRVHEAVVHVMLLLLLTRPSWRLKVTSHFEVAQSYIFACYYLWPGCKQHSTTMLKCFWAVVALIIDYFGIFIDRPSNLKRLGWHLVTIQTLQHRKALVGVTPQGIVLFVSKACMRRYEEVELVANK